MTKSLAVNSKKTAKKKPRGKPFQKGKDVDPRINRRGAPVRGQSYQEAVARLSDMTNEELADFFGRDTPLGQQFLLQPQDVVSRDVMIGRAIITLENDYDARGFEKLTDRSEGKPPASLDLSNKDGTLNPDPLKDAERLTQMKTLAQSIAEELKKKDA